MSYPMNFEKCHHCGASVWIEMSADACRDVFCKPCAAKFAREQAVVDADVEEDCRIADALYKESLQTGWKKDWK